MPLTSPHESQYLIMRANLLERHFDASFLASFPAKMRRLDDKAGAGGSGMVQGPDIDRAVFVRCLAVPEISSVNDNERTLSRHDGAMLLEDWRQEYPHGTFKLSYGITTSLNIDDDSSIRPSQSTQGRHVSEERVIEMRSGDIWMVRWSAVRGAVMRGVCELI